MGTVITHKRADDSTFNCWSGIGSSWSYGSYSGGKTTGYYGNSSSGYAVALFKFKVPTSLPTSAAVTSIKFFIHGCPSVSSGTTTMAGLAKTLPSSDTPSGWLNRSDYLSRSSTCTNGTVGTDVWNEYTFSSFSSHEIKAGDALYFCLYGASSSSLVDYNITQWSPYINIDYETPVAPSAVTRSVSYSGFYGSDQTFTATSGTAGYYFVTTSSPNSSTTTWYKRATSTSNATSCTFIVDQDTSTTALYKTYYLTVIPNCDSHYVGASSNYKTFYAPRYALRLYANSSSPVEINSKDYSTLPSSYNNPSGYTLHGYASSISTTSIDQVAGRAWDATYNGKTRYAVYKKAGSSTSVTLNANGGSISASSATRTVADAWIYGTGQKSGGAVIYSNGSVVPSRSGYKFLGWGTTASQTTSTYSSAQAALDAGYTNILYAIWQQNSGVRIFTSSTASSLYAAYIYNGSSWDYYIPYVYNGSSWQEMG